MAYGLGLGVRMTKNGDVHQVRVSETEDSVRFMKNPNVVILFGWDDAGEPITLKGPINAE